MKKTESILSSWKEKKIPGFHKKYSFLIKKEIDTKLICNIKIFSESDNLVSTFTEQTPCSQSFLPTGLSTIVKFYRKNTWKLPVI